MVGQANTSHESCRSLFLPSQILILLLYVDKIIRNLILLIKLISYIWYINFSSLNINYYKIIEKSVRKSKSVIIPNKIQASFLIIAPTNE